MWLLVSFFQFILSHLQSKLKNHLRSCLLDKFVRKWFLSDLYQVPQSTQRAFSFLLDYLPDDMVSVLGVSKPTLARALVDVLDANGNIISKETPAEIAKNDVSLSFQSKKEELAQKEGLLSRHLKRQKIVLQPRSGNSFETVSNKTKRSTAEEVFGFAWSELTRNNWFKLLDSAFAKCCKRYDDPF